MFKLLEDLLNKNKIDIDISKANLDNYFRKINENINSVSELSETIVKFSRESELYRSLCVLRAELIIISGNVITWRDVLDFKRTLGFFDDGKREAQNLSYPFFLWNGLIYSSKLEGMLALGAAEDLG